MSDHDHDRSLDDYLKSLDLDALNSVLGKVIRELRSREGPEMRVDVVTKSQRLRMATRRIDVPAPRS